jgi:hypothetical protein
VERERGERERGGGGEGGERRERCMVHVCVSLGGGAVGGRAGKSMTFHKEHLTCVHYLLYLNDACYSYYLPTDNPLVLIVHP